MGQEVDPETDLNYYRARYYEFAPYQIPGFGEDSLDFNPNEINLPDEIPDLPDAETFPNSCSALEPPPFLETRDLAAPGIDQLFDSGNLPNASDIIALAESQNWTRVQNPNGPIKYVDQSGITRITIKQGSQRSPGSGYPHVELRNSSGQRVDPFGNPVNRRSPANHTPINYDL